MITIGKKLTPEERIKKCTIEIMGHPRYISLGGVLMIGARMVKSLPPMHTACTNGRDEWYDPVFVESLSDAELRWVILHENGHKMYRHLTTWSWLWDIDPQCANMSCDHVLNLEINAENAVDQFAVMPKLPGICCDKRFKGMAAPQVFEILRKEKQQQQQQQQQGQGKPGKGDETGFDEHDWDDAKDMSDEEKRELAQEIDQAIRQGVLAASKSGAGSASESIKELLKPQVDWRQVMQEFAKNTCKGNDYSTYARPNKRYMSSGLIMPSGVSETMGELVLAMDMSGSTGIGKMRSRFLTEAQEVCRMIRPEKVRLLYWDTRVAQDELYVGDDVLDFVRRTTPKGGGGTTASCVPNYMRGKGIRPQAVIVLTDGDLYGDDWGQWDCPVLWVIVDAPAVFAAVGKTVHADSRVEI